MLLVKGEGAWFPGHNCCTVWFSIAPVLFLYRFPYFLFLFLCLNTLTKVTTRLIWDFRLGVQSITGWSSRESLKSAHIRGWLGTSVWGYNSSWGIEQGWAWNIWSHPSLWKQVPTTHCCSVTVGRSFHTNQKDKRITLHRHAGMHTEPFPLTFRANYYTIF